MAFERPIDYNLIKFKLPFYKKSDWQSNYYLSLQDKQFY